MPLCKDVAHAPDTGGIRTHRELLRNGCLSGSATRQARLASMLGHNQKLTVSLKDVSKPNLMKHSRWPNKLCTRHRHPLKQPQPRPQFVRATYRHHRLYQFIAQRYDDARTWPRLFHRISTGRARACVYRETVRPNDRQQRFAKLLITRSPAPCGYDVPAIRTSDSHRFHDCAASVFAALRFAALTLGIVP